jgi:CheY-like chemotaxis protein
MLMETKQKKNLLNLLLADDDNDDRFFFAKALKTVTIETQLTTVDDGKKLMLHLLKNAGNLPHVLFLDLNMPLKNGSECLEEIKSNEKLKHLPVVIYSTSLHEDVAELLYQKGAYYYVRKTDLGELEKILQQILSSMLKKNFSRPSRSEYIVNLVSV